jgi:molybdopterin-guanine dinucleotide biosynthesis protein A
MGRDKALLALHGTPLVDRAVAILRPVTSEVVLACGPDDRYADRGLARVFDRVADGGPLAGLEAALAHAQALDDPWVCTLACDVHGATPALFRALLDHARARVAQVCMLTSPDGPEPLCAVFHRDTLDPVRAALSAGERRMISFHGSVRVAALAASAAGAGALLNVNTPAELSAPLETTA